MRPRDYAREVIRHESEALADLVDKVGESFDRAVEAILACPGRVIVSGMGKSGLVGRKIAATFNSTGVASFFLHPAEALHGDLGLIRPDDVLMVVSKSGRMYEMEQIIAVAKRLGVSIIALCGTVESDLYERADISLDCSVKSEACPNNLVPTSSSTAALVMGDALALALLEKRDFSPDDFAGLHPGGFLGHRMLKRVSEIHHCGDSVPIVDPNATLSELIVVMTGKRLGCVLTLDSEGKVAGIFTDGDLRRLVEKGKTAELFNLTASEIVIPNFKTINENSLVDAALALMEKHSITQLPTVDREGRLTGLIHLHDILKSKLV